MEVIVKEGEVMKSIYMDHAATTPLYPEVLEAMIPYLAEHFGNPSSIHQFGRKSRHALDEARNVIAHSIQARQEEIVLTSGGTEADNLAIFGYVHKHRQKGNHIITTTIEHHAVLHACKQLEHQGFDVSYVPVNEKGQVSVEDVKRFVREDTIFATIMYGNNEVGTLQPIIELGEFFREKGIGFHTDAVQAFGMIDLDMNSLPVDFLSISAHKINGPKGIGCLYIRNGTHIAPYLHGGEQERKRRAGTENVAGIVGFAKACGIATSNIETKRNEYEAYRSRMLAIFNESNMEFVVNGDLSNSLPHILNVSFPGISVESLLVNLDLAGIAVSSGSACTAGSIDPSHVLVAMFGNDDRTKSAIRYSFGMGNEMEDVEYVATKTIEIVNRIKAL